MSEYKQYNYSGPDELWYNFSGRYTKLLRTRTGIMFNSSTNKYAKVSGMLLSEKIQGYKYKTYIIKVVAAALTESAQPYIYTGFSQNPENRTIIGPASSNEYLEYSVQFTLPETQLFDFGVFFSQRNNVINTVAVNSISLSCMEDDYYVLTHKDSVINSNKDFSGNSITVKKIILDQIEPTGNLNMNGHILTDVGGITLSEDMALHTLSISNAELVVDNAIVLTDSNYEEQIGNHYVSNPASQGLDMNSLNIINLQEIDMVAKTGTKGIAIEVDPLTGFMRYTAGSTGGVDIWGTLYDTEFNQPPFGATATSDLNMNRNSITNVSAITLKPTSGSLKTLSLDTAKNLTYDSNIILTEGNYSNFIMGNTGITGGSSWVGTAKTDLNMDSHDIIHLNEIDMVGADNSTLALSIDPTTKLFRYTTGEWIENDLPNYGLIYDTKFNQPPFGATATSNLNMNFKAITDVFYQTFKNQNTQDDADTLSFQCQKVNNKSVMTIQQGEFSPKGIIYDSNYNQPPFNGSATSPLVMNLQPIENTNYIGFAPNGVSVPTKPTLTIQSDPTSITSGLSVCEQGGPNPGLIYDSYYNKPPFNGTATSALNMNSNAINNVSILSTGQIGISPITIQAEPGTHRLCYTQGSFSSGYGVIYDSRYNKPPGAFPTTVSSALDMNNFPVANVSEVVLGNTGGTCILAKNDTNANGGLKIFDSYGSNKIGIVYDTAYNPIPGGLTVSRGTTLPTSVTTISVPLSLINTTGTIKVSLSINYGGGLNFFYDNVIFYCSTGSAGSAQITTDPGTGSGVNLSYAAVSFTQIPAGECSFQINNNSANTGNYTFSYSIVSGPNYS